MGTELAHIAFLITAIAIGLAVIMAVVVIILLLRLNKAEAHWKNRARKLDWQIGQYDAVFGAYPGLVLVWEDKDSVSETGFGAPKVYGNPVALASLMRFAEPGKSKEAAHRILQGIADRETISGSSEAPTVRQLLSSLRQSGESFAVSIIMPEGHVIEADGRVAGQQVVLWLEDASIRGEDELAVISKFEAVKSMSDVEPVAFVEMMGRAPYPIWRMGVSGHINWANPTYIKAVGGRDLDDVLTRQLHLDSRALDDAKIAAQSQTTNEGIRPIVTANGTRTPMRISLFPINGGIAGVAMDASEADELRRTLARHLVTHNGLLDSMGEAVVSFDADQKLQSYNTAFANLFGHDETWLEGGVSHGHWLDRLRETDQIPPQTDYKQWKNRELARYTNWPEEVPDELWNLPDGRLFRVVRLRDPEGGVIMLFSDMTDEMTLKSQLGTLINVQGATLDKLNEGIAVFGTDGRLRLHNSAFARLWNLTEDALSEEPRFSEIIRLCRPLHNDDLFWADLMARATDPNPDVRRHVDGEIIRSDDRVMRWLSRPLPDGATLIAWEDITASRQTENALRERAKALEEADRMKSEFVGHVSYQLRTPLTTIAGYSDFLQNGGAGELNDKQSEYVFAIQSASEDLAKAIDDILDIAAIEADKLDLELGDVNVFELLDQAQDYVATRAEDTRISVEVQCDQNIGKIRADETRMKQVVYNLLANALRFTKPGGLIELGADRSRSGGLRIWVRDTGVGIPLEKQAHVFESFESSRGGVGLGLTLVQRIIEAHGGWVELDSVEQKGTHVTCYLPQQASTDAAHPELFADVGI